jgi:hypothetical protein
VYRSCSTCAKKEHELLCTIVVQAAELHAHTLHISRVATEHIQCYVVMHSTPSHALYASYHRLYGAHQITRIHVYTHIIFGFHCCCVPATFSSVRAAAVSCRTVAQDLSVAQRD